LLILVESHRTHDIPVRKLTRVDGDNQFRLPYLIESRPPREFNNDAARNRLASITLQDDSELEFIFRVPGDAPAAPHHGHANDDEETGRQSQLLRLFGVVDLESSISVRRTLGW
jgi:DNA mismatch repair protein MSH5